MPDIGEQGQEALLGAKVLVVGTGGLGSSILSYLAAAGVGHIEFLDEDTVSVSNLNRQILHGDPDIGKKKVKSALETLNRLNPTLHYEAHEVRFTRDNGRELIKGMDYVVDASDNFETKFLVNDLCIEEKVPCTIGGVVRWDGQLLSVIPGRCACYRCVFTGVPEPGVMKPPSELGIIGVSAGLVGILMATEAIKHVLRFPNDDRLINHMLMVDLRTWNFTKVEVKRNPSCTACSVCE